MFPVGMARRKMLVRFPGEEGAKQGKDAHPRHSYADFTQGIIHGTAEGEATATTAAHTCLA